MACVGVTWENKPNLGYDGDNHLLRLKTISYDLSFIIFNILPRAFDKSAIVPLKFKRKLEYQSSVSSTLFVRPNVAYDAVAKLKQLGNPPYINGKTCP